MRRWVVVHGPLRFGRIVSGVYEVVSLKSVSSGVKVR